MEALRQGNHEVVEMSYQKTKEFEKLSFLYLLTGNTDKLRKMSKIAEMRGDVMSRFHNALFLGDAEEKMKVFESTGQVSLAYITAKAHGLDADAERYHDLLIGANVPIPTCDPHSSLLQPPTPIFRAENWPLLAVGKSLLADLSGTGGGVASVGRDEEEDYENTGE
jgi:coatomer protein complex subunit alpha (xenin)